jgi:hypothetical protein
MNIKFQPVRVATGSDDENGLLAYADGRLVAVLVHLSELHDDLSGAWFLEAVFGLRESSRTFPNLESAKEWLRDTVHKGRRN